MKLKLSYNLLIKSIDFQFKYCNGNVFNLMYRRYGIRATPHYIVRMSAHNYLSARDVSKFECLPNIKQQKFKYPNLGVDLPPLSANTGGIVNRNLNYSFDRNTYKIDNESRSVTPYSDFFSESETGTPDFLSEESDSSTGSALQRNTAEATRALAEEWERIERTLYDEEGEKSKRLQIIEECKQWRAIHPQLRVVGKAMALPDKRVNFRPIGCDEIIAIHYGDSGDLSDSDERVSQSSTDITPQNSPRVSICENIGDTRPSKDTILEDNEPKLSREKISQVSLYNEPEISDVFSSFMHITPVNIRSPQKKRNNPSILRSEIASSRWMRNSRPDSSVHCDRNSAKSFVSLDTRNLCNLALSASERHKMLNGRVLTARHRDIARLEPLSTPERIQNEVKVQNGLTRRYSVRKVSLPPLLLEEEKKKVPSGNSPRKQGKSRRNSKSVYHYERVKH